jgi:predicted nucleic acid-binding protein
MAAFVPDASATLTWFFQDETSTWTETLLARLKSGDTAIVPQHWPLEVANAFLAAVRRGRVDRDRTAKFLFDLLSLPIRIDSTHGEAMLGQVLAYAEQYVLTIYDAACLELALREGVALATLDNDLRKAALAAGVPLA